MQSANLFAALIVTFFRQNIQFRATFTACSERVKNLNPKNVYQAQETLFDKLNCFGFEYTNEQTLFKDLVLSTLNHFAYKRKDSRTPIPQKGLESIFPSRFPFPQILLKNQFSFATLNLIISVLLLSMLLKI